MSVLLNNRLHTSFLSYGKEVFERLDKLEGLILETRARADPPTRCSAMITPQAPFIHGRDSMGRFLCGCSSVHHNHCKGAVVNGRSYDVMTTKVSSVDDKTASYTSKPEDDVSPVQIGL